jgi:thiol-disulfide isomerase/thioredoxin
MLRRFFTFLAIASLAISVSACSSESPLAASHAANSKAASTPEPRPAPILHVKNLKSGAADLALSDFAGKYVLVDFWATWCAPCREEVPYLKKTYERFASDPRFAMISISLDRGPTAPREYAAAHQMNWSQGFAGTPSQSQDLTTRWKVDVIPAIFLINPEGKIIAYDLRGDEIGQAVSHALQTTR